MDIDDSDEDDLEVLSVQMGLPPAMGEALKGLQDSWSYLEEALSEQDPRRTIIGLKALLADVEWANKLLRRQV